jgi:hypothetical protein
MQQVDLPFDFPFYGHEHNRLWIDPNGYVTFWNSTCFNFYCTPVWPIRWIAPLMTDLDSSLKAGAIRYEVRNTHVTVHWLDCQLYPTNHTNHSDNGLVSPDDTFDFQLRLYPDGHFNFIYFSFPYDPSDYSPSIVGIQDAVHIEEEDRDYLFRYKLGDIPISKVMKSYQEAQHGNHTNHTLVIEFTPTPSCPDFDGSCEKCTRFSQKQAKEKEGLSCGYCPYDKKCADDFGRELETLHPSCFAVVYDLPENPAQCANASDIVDQLVLEEMERREREENPPAKPTADGAEVAAAILITVALVIVVMYVGYRLRTRHRANASYSRQLQNPMLGHMEPEGVHSSAAAGLEMNDIDVDVLPEDQAPEDMLQTRSRSDASISQAPDEDRLR